MFVRKGLKGLNWLPAIAVAAAMLALGTPARAQVKPGDFITADKAGQVRDLVSPGVYYKVARGMSMKIIPTQRIDWPPPYKDATEKYSEQVTPVPGSSHRDRIRRGTAVPADRSERPVRRNQDHVEQRIPPDFSRTTTICVSMTATSSTPGSTNLISRSHTERSATTPATIRWDAPRSSRFRPIRTSSATAGCGCSTWDRNWRRRPRAAPACCVIATPIRTKGDDTWTWETGTRRLRRLNEGLNSSATGSQTFDPDHYSGFNAKTEQYDYKFLGEKNMLACVRAESVPDETLPDRRRRQRLPRTLGDAPHVHRGCVSAAWRYRR